MGGCENYRRRSEFVGVGDGFLILRFMRYVLRVMVRHEF